MKLTMAVSFLFCWLCAFAQLKGRIVKIEDDGFCGSSITFESDSVAYYMVGCEGVQRFTKLNFKILSTGELKFTKVPDSLYQPFIGLTRGKVNFNPYDSLFRLPKLVLKSKERVFTESFWEITGDTVERQNGSLFAAIPERFFTDSILKIRFPELDNLTGPLPAFDFTDFPGEGEILILELDLPPAFTIYNAMSYGYDYCSLSELQFKYINNEFYRKEGKQWILIPKP